LLFNFTLEFAIRKVHGNREGKKLHCTYQLLVYADELSLFGDNIDSTKENTNALIAASKEVSKEVNTEKTKYMLMSRHQNAEQNYSIKIVNRSFANVTKFKYLGTTVTN
jgi:hypothetical protein